jgi:cytochrome c oxidase cbb3-type subunit III
MSGWRRRIVTQVLVLSLASVAGLHAQNSPHASPEAAPPGAPIFASSCAGCHGADGRGGEHAPNIATAPQVQHLADQDLAGIIRNGISGAGMPAFSFFKQQELEDVVSYLRTLQGRGNVIKLPGDPGPGQALYFGKAQCADCHMVNGKGGFLGSDLSFYGADATEEQMRAILLDPEKNLPPEKKATTVVTRTGQTITGMLKASSNFSLTLQTPDGRFHFLPRSELTKIDIGSHSLMPSASTLTPKEMDDLVSYLLRAGDDNAKRNPTHAAKADDDDN